MPFAVSVRIPVHSFLPFDLADRNRLFVHVGAYSSTSPKVGSRVTLHENCRDAEVVQSNPTRRDPSTFDFNLDI
jgi:hypothetical protein